MKPSSLVVFIGFIFSVIHLSSTRTPSHPCGQIKTQIPGPLCFLYYNCPFPGEKNLMVCPVVSIFDEKSQSCVVNSSAWIKCLTDMENSEIDMDAFIKTLLLYMKPMLLNQFYDIIKLPLTLLPLDSNPCSDENMKDCQSTVNITHCIIPYDNCTGYYNCSNPMSNTNLCRFNEKFDYFTRKCVEEIFSSCGIGSSYPSQNNNDHFTFCNVNETDECINSVSPKHRCIFTTECKVYQDCSRDRASRSIKCQNQSNDKICNTLFPNDCKNLPTLEVNNTSGIRITWDSLVFKVGEKAKFVCESNLTSIEGLVWLLNMQEINESERIQIVSEQNKSKLIINPILEQDTGSLTCLVEYDDNNHQSLSIFVIVYALPIITITPYTITLIKELNNSVEFTCNVTFPNSYFYIDKPTGIIWLVNGIEISSSEYSAVSTIKLYFNVSSSVQCCVNTSHHGSIVSDQSRVTFLSNVDIPRACKNETINGMFWGITKAGEESILQCSNMSTGRVYRKCMDEGVWSDINEDECIAIHLNRISKLLDDLNSTSVNSMKLAQLTQQIPSINTTNNIVIITNMSAILFRICSLRKMIKGGNIEAVMETQNVLSSLVNVVQSKAWKSNESLRQSSLYLMQTLNIYSKHEWIDHNFTYAYSSDKLEFERIMMTEDDSGEMLQSSDPTNSRKNQLKIFNKQLFEHLDKNSKVAAAASVTQRLTDGLMEAKNMSKINSDLISMDVMISNSQVFIEFTLQHIQDMPGYSPFCVYWKFNETLNGYWSTDGCELIKSNESHTTCQCSHLTNFAILFSPSAASARDNMILSIISIVGCSISIGALVLTIILYVVKWRILKSKRAILLMCLCVSLIIANIIFLAGVNQTSNPAGCTFVAILLHYFFLTSFFMMSLLAVHLFLSVFFVFFTITKKHIVIMIVLGCLIPFVIVGISMASTRLRGYGNENNCWLSLEYGVLWAFVGPALVIITINMTIAISVLIKICQMKISRLNLKRSKWMSAAQNLVVLNPILGLTWIFGVLSVNKELTVFQYIFAIINSLQGLFIFLLHGLCLKKSLSSQKEKTSDKQVPAKSASSTKGNVDVTRNDKKTMKPAEYFTLNNGIPSSDSNKYKTLREFSSDTFATETTNADSSDKL